MLEFKYKKSSSTRTPKLKVDWDSAHAPQIQNINVLSKGDLDFQKEAYDRVFDFGKMRHHMNVRIQNVYDTDGSLRSCSGQEGVLVGFITLNPIPPKNEFAYVVKCDVKRRKKYVRLSRDQFVALNKSEKGQVDDQEGQNSQTRDCICQEYCLCKECNPSAGQRLLVIYQRSTIKENFPCCCVFDIILIHVLLFLLYLE